jgi:hypothetical protein
VHKVKRWRYYCDFCKKSGQRGYHMQNHERGCTLNPARICGMCSVAQLHQQPMVSLIAAVGDGSAEGMAALRELSENCPACILAAIRQSPEIEQWKDQRFDPECPDPPCVPGSYPTFRYKEETEAFWKSDRNWIWSRGDYGYY